MQNGTKTPDIIFTNQRAFFNTHATRDVSFRIGALKKLKSTVHAHENAIANALQKDLHKSYEEAYLTEISLVLQEIDFAIRKLKSWAQPQRVPSKLQLFPASCYIQYQPLGVSLIIAPWNYPFLLIMTPLISAIAAGCCAILKPSEHTPAVSRIIDEMIHQTFENKYITTVHGDHRVGQHLIQLPFDLIFFTGSTAVGKIVLKAAAENMTPVILELGGKSPCIVDKTANLTIAARRIAWGKGLNSGQTCIAPDYLFVEASIYSKFLDALKNAFRELYGDNIIDSKYYTRIIHEQAYDRLENLLNSGNIYSGGVTDKSQRFISPAILQDVKPTEPIMKEEIFGPLLPILPFSNLMDAIDYINAREKPLALYFFGNEEVAEKVITKTTSGGICINDTILHIANQHLPFGGVGKSGMGKYRGKAGFEAFSHARAIVKAPKWIDLPFRYPPFRYFRWIRKLI